MKIWAQLRNIFLFTLALVHVFFNHRNKKSLSPQKILVIQTAKLGDMVCTTPVFRAIKEKYPSSEIGVIGDGVNKSLLDGNTDVDTYFVFNEKEGILRFSKKVKKEKFDVCVVVGPDFISLVIAILSDTPFIITPTAVGGRGIITRTYTLLSHFVVTKDFRFGAYAPQERLRLLEPLDILSKNTKKYLSFSSEADKKIEQLLVQHRGKLLVGISPSVGNKIKEWPIERFAQVGNYIAKNYNALILIIGGPNDGVYSEGMKNKLTEDVEYIDTTGSSIDETKALISKLSLFISVDTGPIYIAEAFGVPTIDIVGPMDEKEQPPISDIHRVVIPTDREKPELHILNARGYNKDEALRQTESITVEMVTKEVDDLIHFIKKHE